VSNLAWIEFVGIFALAISVALWQYFKMDRELKRDRARHGERKTERDDKD